MANLRMERIGPMELRPGPLKVRKLLAGAGSPELKGVWGPHSEKPGGAVFEDDTRKWVLCVWKVQTGVSFCDRKELRPLG